MVQRNYNNFTSWVQQDDFFTNWPNFIEHKNIDGLRDGYGVTLWPKMNKQFTTGLKSMFAVQLEQISTWWLEESYSGGLDWVIYRMNATDDTPTYTLVNGGNIIAIEELWDYLYLFYKLDLTSSLIGCARITKFAANANTWLADLDETFITSGTWLGNAGIPPILNFNNALYLWAGASIKKIDATWVTDTFWFMWDTVTGITLQGSTIVVYTRWGLVYFWDGVATTYQAIKNLKTRVSKVVSKAGIDYISTEDGQLIIGSGLSFQRVTKPKLSNRMDDNSAYNKRLSFSIDEPNLSQNRSMQVVLDDVYMYASDTIKGIYKYGKLIPWMQDGLHKIITQNHAGTQIDYIYDMNFYERGLRRLYIAYKAGSTYWIDYIDLDSLETCTDGYMISEVFSWGTSLKKEISKLSRATSNTAWNNYIKLYYRVNNTAWVLIENINDATNEIERENLNNDATQSSYKQFIDVQLKIEFHNDTGWQDAPTLHEIMQEYDAID